MVFSSMLFLWIFLPLVLAAYYISPGKIRNGILVYFSLLFYAWGEPLYVFLMLFSVAVNFTGGILIEKYQTRKKKILVATLIINLGLLGYFKYFGTLTEADVYKRQAQDAAFPDQVAEHEKSNQRNGLRCYQPHDYSNYNGKSNLHGFGNGFRIIFHVKMCIRDRYPAMKPLFKNL